jgi:hypothetical protein
MKAQVRFLLVLAVAALLAGWLGLRGSNASLEARLAAAGARAGGTP